METIQTTQYSTQVQAHFQETTWAGSWFRGRNPQPVNNAANSFGKQPFYYPETLNLSSLSYIFFGKRAGLSSHVHTAANSSHRDQKHTRRPVQDRVTTEYANETVSGKIISQHILNGSTSGEGLILSCPGFDSAYS
jgi:hypothetical protein